ADEPAHVDADAALEPVQVVAVAPPAPGDARHQRLARHGLDAHEALDQRVLAARLDGREGQPAVAHDDGGHAVLRLGRAIGVPEELAVEVSVVVDEAGRIFQTAGADGPRRAALLPTVV